MGKFEEYLSTNKQFITEALKEGSNFLLEYIEMLTVQDNYEAGEIGEQQVILNEQLNKQFKNFKSMIKFINDNFINNRNMSIKDWSTFEDGRIDYSFLADEDNNPVDEKDKIFKQWQNGDAKLFNISVIVNFSIIKKIKPTVKEIKKYGIS
jgi:hypothetical protein